MSRRATGFLAATLLTLLSCPLCADDWPQWMGPERDGVWRETGIVKSFPAEGLPVQWRMSVGLGYSGPAVAGGKVYLADFERTAGEVLNNSGTRVKLEGNERVTCLDAASGKRIWTYEYDCPYEISYPSGPRATPTFNDGKLYCLGAEGHLLCLDAATGRVIWQKQLVQEYKVRSPHWGYSHHPLVDGDTLFCLPGGDGTLVVALDKNTGKEIWRNLSSSDAGYCPPTMIQHGDQRQLVIWHPEAINGLDPASGKIHWTVPLKPAYRMSVTAPTQHGDYLYASGIGNISALLKLSGTPAVAEVAWRGTTERGVFCSNSTPIIDDGILYGFGCRKGELAAVELPSGKILWESFKATGGERPSNHGTAMMTRHANGYFLFNEHGELILAQMYRQGYRETSRMSLLKPTGEAFGRSVVWSYPAFSNRSIYVRNDKEIICVSLASE
jgi:outer membrane protein assembly factor BamB